MYTLCEWMQCALCLVPFFWGLVCFQTHLDGHHSLSQYILALACSRERESWFQNRNWPEFEFVVICVCVFPFLLFSLFGHASRPPSLKQWCVIVEKRRRRRNKWSAHVFQVVFIYVYYYSKIQKNDFEERRVQSD